MINVKFRIMITSEDKKGRAQYGEEPHREPVEAAFFSFFTLSICYIVYSFVFMK